MELKKVTVERLLEPAMRQAFADGMRLGREQAENIDEASIDTAAAEYAKTVADELLSA